MPPQILIPGWSFVKAGDAALEYGVGAITLNIWYAIKVPLKI